MDPVKVVWLPAASQVLDQEHDYLTVQNPQAARIVFARIAGLIRRLADLPQTGRSEQNDGTRELTIPSLPYRIIYRVATDQVEILRVFRTAGDTPGPLS